MAGLRVHSHALDFGPLRRKKGQGHKTLSFAFARPARASCGLPGGLEPGHRERIAHHLIALLEVVLLDDRG